MIQVLNLTEGFSPLDNKDSININYKFIVFNGGEPNITLLNCFGYEHPLHITIRIKSFDDLGKLAVAVDAARRAGISKEIHLFMPYFPAARQDRVCNPGEALTVKVYADMINAMKFHSITIFDPHSEVTPALLDNCISLTNHSFVNKCLIDIYGDKTDLPVNIISPDAGANKKVQGVVKAIGYSPRVHLIKCDKTRDLKTGSLSGFEVYTDDLLKIDCVIVDDICDGGGTFIGLAEELKKKNAGNIYLIASHGIFSKLLKAFKPYFKKIYTTDSWRSEFHWEEVERGYSELVKIINFKEFI